MKAAACAAGPGRYKPYPAYKDSGVEWLGEIPAGWEALNLKRVCRFAYGDSLASDSRLDGDIDVYGSNGAVGTHEHANTLAPCLVIGRKGSFGKVNFSARPVFAIDTTFFVDARFTRTDIRWLYYALTNARLDSATKDSAIPGLDREDAYAREVCVCPPEEQRAIAAFLDRETARIDALVAKKAWLIALLQEQRTALITRAVTKGLDPTVPMKDSGVEWLGEIPAHWEVRKLKFLLAAPLKYGANEAAELDEPDLPRYVRITDIDESDGLRDETFKSLPVHVAEEYLLREGDLLFARSGATAGKTFLYRRSWGTCAYAGYLIRARLDTNRASPQFVRYFTASTSYWQ
jgi:restriction endonuclease S subunit